jgi:DNA-binding MarR family transcriptional regulator
MEKISSINENDRSGKILGVTWKGFEKCYSLFNEKIKNKKILSRWWQKEKKYFFSVSSE